MVPFLSPERRGAPGLQFAIIWMCPKTNDPQPSIVRRHLDSVDLGESGKLKGDNAGQED